MSTTKDIAHAVLNRAARIFIALVVGGIIAIASAMMQHQAADAWAPFGLDKICDAQYTMNAPSFSDSTIESGHTTDGTNIKPTKVSYTDITDFWGAYGSAGYEWTNYESLPCNPVDTGTTTAGTVLSNWIFGAFTGLLGLLRAYINVPFSNDFVEPFLSSQTVQDLFKYFDQNLIQAGFLTAVTGIGGSWILLQLHKNGTKLTLFRIIGSIVASAAAAVIITTQVAMGLYSWINSTGSYISLIPAAAVSSTCSGVAANDPQGTVNCVSGSITSKIINPVYFSGAIGENQGDAKAKFITKIAGQPEEVGPGSKVIYNKKSTAYITDDKNWLGFDSGGQGDKVEITLPAAGVVPTVNSDNPTWGEYMHWTTSYTKAEREAIENGDVKACNFTTMPELEKLHEQAEKNPDLCTQKWMVRAALMYSMANGGGGYPTAAGKTPFADRLPAATSSVIPTALVVDSMAILGLHRLIITLELIFLALMLWFHFVVVAFTGNWSALQNTGLRHALIFAKIVGLGLVLSGTILSSHISYNIFEQALPGIPLYVRSNLSATITVVGFIACYILYFRGMRKFVKMSPALVQAQGKSFTGRIKTTGVTALNIGAAAAGAAVTGGASAALGAAIAGGIKTAQSDKEEKLDVVKEFDNAQRRATTNQFFRERNRTNQARKQSAANQAIENRDHINKSLTDVIDYNKEYDTLVGQYENAQTEHDQKIGALTNTKNTNENKELEAKNQKEALTQDKTEHDQKIRERLNLMVGANRKVLDENGKPITGPNGETVTYADQINQASAAVNNAKTKQDKAQDALNDYLTKNNLEGTSMHTMNYDANNNPTDVTVTDLTTGETNTLPTTHYDHELSQESLFPNPENYQQYQELATALANATAGVTNATSGYEALTQKLRSESDAVSAKMYDPNISNNAIAAEHKISVEQVSGLRGAFKESAELRDQINKLQSDENVSRRAAKTASADIDKAVKAHYKNLENISSALQAKQGEIDAAAKRARELAASTDKLYSENGIDNYMKKVSRSNPYIISTSSGSMSLSGQNMREAVDRAIAEANDKTRKLNLPNELN